MKEENIHNIPNGLSLFRVLISPILVLLVYFDYNIILIASLFIVAALTDFLDGFIARRYDLVTRFGRRLDMIADRVLMISLIFALVVYLLSKNMLTPANIELMALLMTREILCFPFLIIALIKKSRAVPHARFAGKLTTTLQGFTFPMIILGWKIAPYFVIATAISGIICAGYYIFDALIRPNNEFQKEKDRYYARL